MPVQQRAAGVSGVDGSVGLNGLIDSHPVWFLHWTNGADNPARHRSRQAEGVSDRVDFLSHAQVARVSKGYGCQVGSLDLNDREIVWTIGTDNGCAILLAIRKSHLNLASFGNDVVVREDVSLFVDDEPSALPFLRNEPVKEIKRNRAGCDVHDRREVLLVHADVVLLFGIQYICGGSLCDLNLGRSWYPARGLESPMTSIGRVIENAPAMTMARTIGRSSFIARQPSRKRNLAG